MTTNFSRKHQAYARPPLSAPREAALPIGLLFLAWGSVAPVTALAFGTALSISYNLIGEYFLVVVAIAAAPFLAVAFGCRKGTIWSIFLFQGLALVALIFGVIDLAAGALLSFGAVGFKDVTSRNTGLYVCICAGVLFTLSLALVWSMRRVRWLDPYSTPDEWETPINRAARRPN